MASPSSFGGDKKPEPINSHQPVLAVAPLNSMPYVAPMADDGASLPTTVPPLVFPPSDSIQKEWEDIVASGKCGVHVSGSATAVGPVVGSMEIGESDDAYCFRVFLPGVSRDEKEFSCNIEPNGKILIKGVTTTGETTVCKKSLIFRMQTRNLCPPGHFSIQFQLPGPVDHQQFTGHFKDGILEGIVKKRQPNSTSEEGNDAFKGQSISEKKEDQNL